MDNDGPTDWSANLQCIRQGSNIVPNISETKSPNHGVFLLFHFFRSKYGKFHAKDGPNQQKQEDESVLSNVHNPWFANHVSGVSGAQLRKA
jgi:hypothetical protein